MEISRLKIFLLLSKIVILTAHPHAVILIFQWIYLTYAEITEEF